METKLKQSELSNLFQHKIAVLEEILSKTQSVAFKDNDQDVDIYASLMEQREALVNKAKELDIKIQTAEAGEGVNAYPDLQQKIKQLAKQIIAQDNYMAEAVNGLRERIKQEIKEVHEGRSVSNAYQKTNRRSESYFDLRQ